MKNALIIFFKNPVLGKVKTRLAATLGAHEALKIYNELVQYTHAITTPVNAARHVFYSDGIEAEDVWLHGDFKKLRQQGTDLGERMQQAFAQVFAWGFEKVVIIGCDCMELTQAGIEQAFDALDEKDVVIGPAQDGGYYLLGMKGLHAKLFFNKQWSTPTVFGDTLCDLHALRLTHGLLKKLSDVDEAADLWTMKKSPVRS